MARTNSGVDQPILLGELRAAGIGITLRCVLCPRSAEMDPKDLPDGDDVSLRELVDYARCTGCGSRRGGLGISPDWPAWIRHLRRTGQHGRLPWFACFTPEEE